MGIQADAYIRLLLDHADDPGRMTVAGVSQHQFAGLKAKLPESFRRVLPSGQR